MLGLVCFGRGIAGSEELEMGVGKRNEVCYYGDNFLLFDRASEDDSLNTRRTLREELIPMYSQESVDSS